MTKPKIAPIPPLPPKRNPTTRNPFTHEPLFDAEYLNAYAVKYALQVLKAAQELKEKKA